MHEPGPLLASGRDADIYTYGAGAVLRRSRERRSLADEARTMSYLHDQGYPVPEVIELSADGVDLVMQRIDGPSMVEAMGRQPWTIGRHARALAALHERLHAIEAPAFMRAADVGTGKRIVHMDLHPLNVIVGRDGPVVIDWARSGAGDPVVDVTAAWLLMSTAATPATGVRRAVIGLGRSRLTSAFLGRFDREEVMDRLPSVVAWKAEGSNMSDAEIAAMRRLVAERSLPT